MSLLQDEIDRLFRAEEDDLERRAEQTQREVETRRHVLVQGGRRCMADDLDVVRQLRRMESLNAEPDSLRVIYLRAKEHLEREGQKMLGRLSTHQPKHPPQP